ncbi:MAG: glycosyltransferase family 2 protein, partial [Nitrospirota bacterium]
MKFLAIIPAYNEEATVGLVVAEIHASIPEAHVVVINDGSADGTAIAASAAGAAVVNLPFNMGIGAAVQAGYRYALQGGYDIAAQVDGDGQHDPSELIKIIEPIRAGKADIVVGSRFLGGDGFKSTAMRRVGISSFARVLSVLTGGRLTDPTSGFRACNRKIIRLFAQEYPEDYPEVESLLLAHLAGLRISEAQVKM